MVLALVVVFAFAFGAQGQAKPKGIARIAVDAQSGEVLYASRSETRWHPASLTKMMTLYQLFSTLERRKLTLDSRIKISRRAARQPPSKLGLRPGNTITVRTAIESLAIKSANDVAVAVAEKLGGSERAFAKQMTKTARRLGMNKTTFRNASGLHHSKQITTARDMAILSIALMRDFPQYYSYFSKKDFRFARRRYTSHNHLLAKYTGADGIKTGYIAMSGFNLAASAVRNNRRVVGVVLGARSSSVRTVLMTRLLNTGFSELKKTGRPRIARPLHVRLTPPPPIPRPRYLPGQTQWPRIIPIPRQNPHYRLAPPQPATASAGVAMANASSTLWAADARAADYAVQVGAYRTPNLARQQLTEVLDALPAAHSPAAPKVVSFRHPSRGTFYRARLAGYDSRRAASATCDWLKAHRTDCAVVASSEARAGS